MERYDEHLAFDLPEGYEVVTGTNDDGDPFYNIKAGKSVDGSGKQTYENTVVVKSAGLDDSPFSGGGDASGFRLEGGLENRLVVASQEMALLFVSVNVYTALIWLRRDEHVYVLLSTKVVRAGDVKERTENWAAFLNGVLAALTIDGVPGSFEPLTADKLLSAKQQTDEKPADNSDIPAAKPLEGQHTHFDFLSGAKNGVSLLGGLLRMNQTGTEFSLQPISNMVYGADEQSPGLGQVYQVIANAPAEAFPLAQTARTMAELFRVDAEFFDPVHDREQEIDNGMIQRAAVFESFRSFAWTLCAYCEKHGLEPASVSYDAIQDIVSAIEARGGLNYTADSHSPVLCSGDDLHVYYLPDSVPGQVRQLLLQIVDKDADGSPGSCSGIQSLEGLRRELEHMYPAMRTIYDELERDRDRETPLTGGTADVLYAWCAVTYAARAPIFSEDGPMTCWWEHPDSQAEWERKMKISQLEQAMEQQKQWLQRHQKDLTKNAPIVVRDRLFVFAGVQNREEWLDILEKLLKMGGVQRSAVSGKTNYLVCDPLYAGDSQVRNALEQRLKGKDVKIVLLDDLLKVLHMTVKSPQQKIEELKAEAAKKPEKKQLEPVQRPEPAPAAAETAAPSPAEKLSYEQRLQGRGRGYVLDIPDGFVVREGAEDRDFIAYLPNEEAPDDYQASSFIIYAGQRQENELFGQFRTVAEFTAVIHGMSGTGRMFSDSRTVVYERPDLPGGMIVGYDQNCMHVNAYVGMAGCLQGIRLQITGVERKDRAAYEDLARSILDHMRSDQPVTLLEPLDAGEFMEMPLQCGTVERWTGCVGEHVSHITIARQVEQTSLVNLFKRQQAAGDASVPQLKRDLKNMLRSISRYAEEDLRRAEAVYTVKRAQYPDSGELAALRQAVDSLVALADQQVTLDGQPIQVTSELAARVKARLDAPVLDVIGQLLQELSGEETAPVRACLEKVRDERGEAIRAAEAERARRRAEEEERKRRQAEEKERRRREEAERRAAEEKARKEREEAEKKRREEKARLAHEKVLETLDRDRARARIARGLLACSGDHVVAVKPDGTVIAAGRNDHNQCNVSGWRDIVAVDCDLDGTVGLTADGRVKYTGWNVHRESSCTAWAGIKQVVMSDSCVFGLKNDGTVVATPAHAHANSTAPDVSSWRSIVQIRRGGGRIVGIDANGKARSVRRNYYGRTDDERTYPGGVIDAVVSARDDVCLLTKEGCSAFPKRSYQPQEIVCLSVLSNRPMAILSNGRVLLSATRKNAVDTFVEEHKKERFIAAKGSYYKCAFLTEDGRIIVAGDESFIGGKLPAGEPFGEGFRLFDSFDRMMEEREQAAARAEREKAEAEQRRREEEAKRAERRAGGVCQYCGGAFKKGMFSTKCVVCGKRKDY